jgi:hypothetical protein
MNDENIQGCIHKPFFRKLLHFHNYEGLFEITTPITQKPDYSNIYKYQWVVKEGWWVWVSHPRAYERYMKKHNQGVVRSKMI